MKCPMFDTGRGKPYEPIPPYSRECLKGECAWWDKVLGQCVAVSIGDWLENLHSIMSGMLDKMPHEAQFRK